MRRWSFRMRGPCRFECIVPVISSEARNPGEKTKISQSQPLTSFETRSLEMTKVNLWRLSGGGESGHMLDEAALIPTEISRTRTCHKSVRSGSRALPSHCTYLVPTIREAATGASWFLQAKISRWLRNDSMATCLNG